MEGVDGFSLPSGLSDLEIRVLTDYLDEVDEDREALINMLACVECTPIDRTGVGFFRHFVTKPQCYPAFVLEDSVYKLAVAYHPDDLTPIEFMLRVKNGQLDYLEAVSYVRNWPEDEERIVFEIPGDSKR